MDLMHKCSVLDPSNQSKRTAVRLPLCTTRPLLPPPSKPHLVRNSFSFSSSCYPLLQTTTKLLLLLQRLLILWILYLCCVKMVIFLVGSLHMSHRMHDFSISCIHSFGGVKPSPGVNAAKFCLLATCSRDCVCQSSTFECEVFAVSVRIQLADTKHRNKQITGVNQNHDWSNLAKNVGINARPYAHVGVQACLLCENVYGIFCRCLVQF